MRISQSHTQPHITRLGITLLCFSMMSLGACTPSNQSTANPDTNSTTSPVASPATNPDSQAATTPVSTASDGTPKEQVTAIVGTQKDGWLPKVLANKGLKKGLTPADTGKIISGAEKVSDYGFSKVTVNDIPGLKQYEFYYAKDSSGKPTQLQAVKLLFDPALNESYPDLVSVLSNKYGAAKPEDVEKQIIVWVGPSFVTAQLTKQVTDFGGYELNVSLEEQ